MDLSTALDAILNEFSAASSACGPFNSAHEGYAIILEELDELWDQVRLKDRDRDIEVMKKEATQVGAMALRFLVDVC